MGELIKVEFNHEGIDGIAVSARELHERLGIKGDFTHWFKRQQERAELVENADFYKVKLDSSFSTNQDLGHGGDRRSADYIIPFDIAKHLCMMSGGEMAHRIREEFIRIEKQWNSPEAVKRRALEFMHRENLLFQETIAGLELTLLEQKPKIDYYNDVLTSKSTVLATVIAKDYGMGVVEFNKMLHKEKIQFKKGGVWVLYQEYADKGYTHSETRPIRDRFGNPTGYTYMYQGWTQKGRRFLYDILKERRGLVPTVERVAFQEIQQTIDTKSTDIELTED